MKKKLILIVATLIMMLGMTACRKPYDVPEFVTIEASQTAFLVPLTGDTSNQASFESEELLEQAKVATKEVQIPHRWVQTGRRSYKGEWRPSAKLIVVERKPVSRSWESIADAASPENKAIFGETLDAIGIYVAMNCTAQIDESNATKFLYRYNNTPLETVVDNDIKKKVEDEFNMATAKYSSSEIHAAKDEIMNTVKANVIKHFEEYGITITVLGMKEGISFENKTIQDAIDKKFASEQDLIIQQNANDAALAKAEADAKAKIIAAEAEAEANRLLSASITETLIRLKEAENEAAMFEKWDGKLPTVQGADSTWIEMPSK